MSMVSRQVAGVSGDVSCYVSNSTEDVYAIAGLPEEVIAVIFAYVSRSPKSFRENLLQVSAERAQGFHEKWVLQYGHASIAEHAVVHLGIEKVSRLFSAVLECSNPYLSFTEYSQRYQQPARGDYYVLHELGAEYKAYQNSLYDSYEKLLKLLTKHYEDLGHSPSASQKHAFEDARYVLSLATYTSLGMTANGRALSDALKVLFSSEYPEVTERATQIKTEAQKHLPTLIKYAEANTFLLSPHSNPTPTTNEPRPLCLLFKHGLKSEAQLLPELLTTLDYPRSSLSRSSLYASFTKLSHQELAKHFLHIMQAYSKHDPLPKAFESVSYEFEISLSEASWHQLLRHRRITFHAQAPHVGGGYVVPPSIQTIKEGEALFVGAMNRAELYFKKLYAQNPAFAHYTVTNAHRRSVQMTVTLKDLYHLAHLRGSVHAQWEIRELVVALLESLKSEHPTLLQPLWRTLD